MKGLVLVAVGQVPAGVLAALQPFLTETTGLAVEIAPHAVDPAPAYDPERGQLDSRKLLPVLEQAASPGLGILGVADRDLYSAVFTFVLGESKLGGPAGLVSVYRLRASLVGMPDDPAGFEARARRLALHETGHLLGLIHCRVATCVMRFSGTPEEVDLKDDRFCRHCRDALSAMSRSAPREPR